MMQCPKCNKELKHIGIDYDKPSEIHTCKSCMHSSQETKMKAKCIDCGEENHLDQLSTYAIKRYTITEKAQQKALSNLSEVSFQSLGDAEAGEFSTPYVTFKLIKDHEKQKSNVYGDQLYLLAISFDQSISKNLNEQLKTSLFEELAGIVKPYLKKHDLVTISPSFDLELLLINYSNELALELEDTLQYNLRKMLKDNGMANDNMVNCKIQLLN